MSLNDSSSPPDPSNGWLAAQPLFVYTVTPDQVDTSTGTDNPVTLNLGIFNPKKNGAVAVKHIEFAISIGTTENSLTTDWQGVEGRSNQTNWIIQKQSYTQSPLIFKVTPALTSPPTTGLNEGEAISFMLTGINVNDTPGPAAIRIAEETEKHTEKHTALTQQLVNKASPSLQITSFQANPSSINQPGDPTTLSWTTTGASSCTLSGLDTTLCSPPGTPPYLSPPGPGLRLEPNGQVTVCPLGTTIYTLTAYEHDRGHRELQLAVAVGGAVIIRFWPEPFVVAIDCMTPQVTLNWELENAGKVTLYWNPGNLSGTDVTGLDYFLHQPLTTTTYTLMADGVPPATAPLINMTVEPAAIQSFTATPDTISRHQSATLAWETEHACACSIDQGVGAVTPAAQGSIKVTPLETTLYTLTAQGIGEAATSQSKPLTVLPSEWYLATTPSVTANVLLSYKGQLWAIDAYSGSVMSSPDGVNWTTVTSSLPLSNVSCCGVVFDDGGGEKIWLLTGSAIWSSADGATWTEVQPRNIWPARTYFGCLVFQNKIWVMGGENPNTLWTAAFSDVWSSKDGINWEEVTSNAPWGERTRAGAAVYNPTTPSGINQMWLCGGCDVNGNSMSDTWYTNDGVTWQQATTPAWEARCLTSLVMLNDQLWMLGGWQGSSDYLTDMWVMDAGMNWKQLPAQMPPQMSSNPPTQTIFFFGGAPAVAFDWRIWEVPFDMGGPNGVYFFAL